VKIAIALIAVAGCYLDFRPGITAPAGHGHGSWGGDFGGAAGFDHLDPRYRVGGGIAIVSRLADDNGYVAVGLEAHTAIVLSPTVAVRRLGQWLLVSHLGVGGAAGLPRPAPYGDAPDGVVAQGFLGIGLGYTSDAKIGHLALGVSTTRFFPVDNGGDAFWFLGGALDVSFVFEKLPFSKHS
jgi:hypothetical protein